MRPADPHTHVADLLPLYVAGALDPDAARKAQEHLAWCASCRRSLEAWHAVAEALHTSEAALPLPSPHVLARALTTIDGEHAAPHQGTAARGEQASLTRYLGAQARLIPRALWGGVAITLVVAALAAVVSDLLRAAVDGGHMLSSVVPLVAALGIASLVTPVLRVQPDAVRGTLLARCGLALGYIIVLATAASAAVALMRGVPLWSLAPLWLGPVLLLATVSLWLSLLVRPAAGVTGACGLCVLHILAALLGDESVLSGGDVLIRALWTTTPLVLVLSGLLTLGAALYAPRAAHRAGRAETRTGVAPL